MRARIRKWGNSLALRIPKSFAEETFLSDDSIVDIKVVNGKLVVTSVTEPETTLDNLLADVDESNVHEGIPVEPAGETKET